MRSHKFASAVAAIFVSAWAPAQPFDPHHLWTSIRDSLAGPEGDEYFQESMKDALLPPLRGTLLKTLGVPGGNSFILAMSDPAVPDVALMLRGAAMQAASRLTPGVQVVFVGVPSSFIRSPFLVTFDIEENAVVLKPLAAIAPAWYIGPELGSLGSGHYRHHVTRLKFDVPSDWKVEGTRPSTGGDVVTLILSGFEHAFAGVWMAGNFSKGAEVNKSLEAAPAEFVGPRTGLENYAIRPDSIRQQWIAGRQAVTALADYKQNGQKMSESLTWIVTEHTRALFFARTTAYDLPILQTHFDQIIQSAVIP